MRMEGGASSIPYHQLDISKYYYYLSSDILGIPVPYTYDGSEEIDHRLGCCCINNDDMVMGFCNLHNDHQLIPFEAAGSSTTSCSSAAAAAAGGLLMPNISSAFPIAHHDYNLGIEGKHVLQANIEDNYNDFKVGRYSVEERKERILRYLKKRNQRNFNKTIKYACRKTLADKRVRIRGRFAKNDIKNIFEPSHEDHIDQVSKTFEDHQYSNYQHDDNSFYQHIDSFQILYDEDEALQAAMDNLVHLPYK
ncbi:hypothetical protein ACJIZ3_012923 [Penstemon smallii]|uniref:CCT domain-containing protein n=1 Tax=Penstemon smallii TaxID=265156 RepID=A0ABD3UQJ1_9LAMI